MQRIEKKSFTAKAAKDTKEKKSLTAKAAKDAKERAKLHRQGRKGKRYFRKTKGVKTTPSEEWEASLVCEFPKLPPRTTPIALLPPVVIPKRYLYATLGGFLGVLQVLILLFLFLFPSRPSR